MITQFDCISDVHIDHHVKEVTHNKVRSFIKTYLLPTSKDFLTKSPVLVLAGDIIERETSAKVIFEVFKEFYEEVIYVYGNHECYCYSKEVPNTELKLSIIRNAAVEAGVYMLEGETINIQGTTFGGGSAWYDFSYGYKFNNDFDSMYDLWQGYMSDARLIADYFYTIAYSSKLYPVLDFKAFRDKRLNEIKQIENADVIVTHVSPVVPESIPKEFQNETTGFYFYDGAEDVKRINPKVWVFGHTHSTYDFMYENTRFICNPCGYPSERSKKNLTTRIKTVLIKENHD